MASRISPDFLEKLKSQVSIIDVVSEYVVLRKAGSNYSGLCPFHAERSPSFTVSEQKQLYHCYGCKKGGDLIGFVMEMGGLSFPEAIEDLAKRARVELPKDFSRGSGEDSKKKNQEEDLFFKLNRFVAAFFQSQLPKVPGAVPYLKSRKVTEESLRQFHVGAAPADWDQLAKHLEAKKAPIPIAEKLGLIRPSERGMGHFDLFRDRLVFPILDLRGRVLGFGGRKLGTDKDSPKYLNSSESPIFQKSKVLYGIFQAQKFIRDRNRVILVEGYFDVIGMHQAGFSETVATCGTALTLDHAKRLKRLADEVIVLFDGDQAGQSAMEKAMELGLTQGWIFKGAVLPAGKDPDELCLENPQAVRDLIDQARPILDQKFEQQVDLAKQSVEAKASAIKTCGKWLGMLQDPVGQSVRAQWLAEKLQVSEGVIRQAMGGLAAAPSREMPRPMAVVTGKRSVKSDTKKAISVRDQVLLRALMSGGQFEGHFDTVLAKLPKGKTVADLFDSDSLRGLVTAPGGEPEAWGGLRQRLASLDPSTQVSLVLREALLSESAELDADQVTGALSRAIHQVWARFSQEIQAAMKSAEVNKDAGLLAQLSEEYLDVRRRMEEFNNSPHARL